jgi:hypothetical protein
MGWKDVLKKVAAGSSSAWEPWATSHGWQYVAEDPELAGRFFDLPPDPKRTGERYLDVVRGDWEGRPFIAFRRQMSGRPKGGGHRNYENVAAVAIQLPGRPRPDFAAQEARAAFKSFCDIPGWCNWAWVEPDWLLATRHVMKPEQADTVLQHVTFALTKAPAGAFVA